MSTAEFIGILTAIVTVGMGLATLVLRGQHLDSVRAEALGSRIDSLDSRMGGVEARLLEVEKGQARLEGFIAGTGHPLGRGQPRDS